MNIEIIEDHIESIVETVDILAEYNPELTENFEDIKFVLNLIIKELNNEVAKNQR